MPNKNSLRGLWFYGAFSFFLVVTLVTEVKSEQTSRPEYWAPKNPPKAHYKIECSIDLSKGSIEGIESICFRNSASRPTSRLKINWTSLGNIEIRSNGKAVKVLSEIKAGADLSVLIELAKPVYPGEKVELGISFAATTAEYAGKEEVKLPFWYPRLDWGFETHDDYDVKIDKTSEYLLVTSGVLVDKSGYYHAENVKRFGLFLGKSHKVIEANAKDVLVQVVYKAEAEECARLVLETAVQAINFYHERFGLYPYRSLAIIPGGMTHPAGGYPIATSMVGIHAMEQFNSMPKLHWQWITAHEIGHQYWGEYVMEKDKPGWLWIGMGIYADREYVRAKGLGLDKHRGLMSRYIQGVRDGLDTTVARSQEQRRNIKFDFNNVVIHGKGYSIISALDSVLGHEAFYRVYKRCLKEFGGKRLGVHEFRTICERESEQDLGWFFDQWVNSNRYLSYEIVSKSCKKKGTCFISKVEVRCLGDLKMPVPITVYYEDGSSRVKYTDRLLDTNVLEFESSSPLKEVRLDPANKLALVVPPPSGDSKALGEILELPWSGAGDKAFELYKKTKELQLESEAWYKLGLNLYDSKHYEEALEAFRSIITAPDKAAAGEFMSLVWQGHLLDIFKRRDEALKCYRKALDVHTKAGLNDFKVRHDQYKMVVNRSWVEQRIEKPFERSVKQDKQPTKTDSNFEVLDIKVDPIREGQNVVHIKVKNTSTQDQIFATYIQTRSSDGGWGTTFIDIIKAGEIRWTQHACKIRGAFTNETYLRLQLYNPAPAEGFGREQWFSSQPWDNWFKKVKYFADDLEHYKADESQVKAASKSQAEDVIKALRQLQNHIKNKEYEAAWELFTQDFREAEFQIRGLERFKECMESPQRFYLGSKELLSFEPKSVNKKGDTLALTAKMKGKLWGKSLNELKKQWHDTFMKSQSQ